MRTFILLYLLSFGLQAQLVNSGSLVSITENAVVGVDANFLNTGNIQNRGTVYIKRNWMNLGVYDSLGGELIFNGTQSQRIMNNGQNIDKLVISNGVKNLDDDLVITDALSLNNTILVVNEEANLTLGQGVLITGAGQSAYIDGRLSRVGTGDLFYPIGDDGEYLPATLVEVLGNDPRVSLEAVSSRPTQELGGDLEEVVVDHYWILTADERYGGGFLSVPYETDSTNLVVGQATSETGRLNTIGSIPKDGDAFSGIMTSKGNAVGTFFTVARAPENTPLPPLKVVNVLTPFQDGKHDFLRIENIELYPNNQVEVFDRQGNKVFSIQNYNNRDRVFRGSPNTGLYSRLPDGNYFYTIRTSAFNVTSGFLFLKR